MKRTNLLWVHGSVAVFQAILLVINIFAGNIPGIVFCLAFGMWSLMWFLGVLSNKL